LAGREIGALLKIREDHLVRARSSLLAAKIQPDRPTMADDDRVRRIAALHQDHRLLVTSHGLDCAQSSRTLEPEEPDDEQNSRYSKQRENPAIGSHDLILSG
jgi:hypothetical protein